MVRSYIRQFGSPSIRPRLMANGRVGHPIDLDYTVHKYKVANQEFMQEEPKYSAGTSGYPPVLGEGASWEEGADDIPGFHCFRTIPVTRFANNHTTISDYLHTH